MGTEAGAALWNGKLRPRSRFAPNESSPLNPPVVNPMGLSEGVSYWFDAFAPNPPLLQETR
jgi:hypothetical protein